ncbi:MAG: ABC transporter substrate-binding protein [Asticcacaulis sp.]
MTRLLGLIAIMLCLWAPVSAQILTVGTQLEPPNLDPTSGAAAPIDEVVSGSVFETLLTLDRAGQLKPVLALSWQVASDGLSVDFRLRPDVRFHDGSVLTAENVRFSLLRAIADTSSNAERTNLSVIKDVQVIAPDQVRLLLKKRDAGLLYHLTKGDAAILSLKGADRLAEAPVGTGPFRFVSWRRGDSVSLKRFDGYWGGPARVEGVTFRFLPDPTAALSAVRAGDVQLFPEFPSPESLEALQKDSRFKVTVGPSEAEVILAINNRNGPLRDVRVRQALSHAIDKNAVRNGAMYGYGQLISSHFPPQNAAFEDLSAYYPYDPARARQLLAQAGYADGFDVTLNLPPPVYARRSGEIIAAQLAQVGIRVTIRNSEWAGWLDQVFMRHDFDLTVISHAEALDYDIYGRKDYYFGFDNAGVQATLSALNAEDNPQAREALLRQVQRDITQAAPNVFLYQYPRLFVADARVRGAYLNAPMQVVDWHNVYIDGVTEAAAPRQGSGVAGLVAIIIALGFAAGLVVIGRQVGIGFVVRRLAGLGVTLLVSSLVVFAIVQGLPGDPAAFMMGLNASPEALTALRNELGLNAPFWSRYLGWVGGLLSGDFGVSYVYKAPVADLLAERMQLSLPLAGLSVLLALLIGIPVGIISAVRRGKWSDRIWQGVGEVLIATPNFVLAIVLILGVAVALQWAPAGGFAGWQAGLGAGLASLALPALSLALPQAAVLARILRGSLIEALSAPWIATAKARGLPTSRIIARHALPNALHPVITVLGLQVPFLIAGSAIIESAFALPGLGRLAFQAVGQRDLIVVQAVVMVLVALVVVCGFVTELAQAWLDPRTQAPAARKDKP